MKTTNLIKRNGSIEAFDPQKIANALTKAGKATGEFDEQTALEITYKNVLPIIAQLEVSAVDIETVQNAVEQALFEVGFQATNKAYILYRAERARHRTNKKAIVDVESSMNEYLDQSDWRVKANANQGYSLGGMILNVSGKLTANYWLSSIYPEEVGLAHRNGDFHIHDLDMLSGYCCGHSLRALLTEGFNGVPNKVESNPPKHLSTACGQMVNFLGTLQNEFAGAQAFSSFDTYLAPYIRVDNLEYKDVKQCIQEFIYSLNVPSRWGCQSPFTNLTFDLVCPDDLRDQHPMIGGQEVDFTYGELQSEMDMINRAYIEVMTEGDAHGRIFTFPIPTYNITDDFQWDSPIADQLFEMTAKYGLPYFQNFLNSDLDPHMIRSMCPLGANTKVLIKVGNEIRRSLIGDITQESFETLHNGSWYKSRLVKVEPQKTYRVTLTSGDRITFGEHHLQPVFRNGKSETISAKELVVGDWLPYTKKTYDTDLGSYEFGFALGAYLGDGSRNHGEEGGIQYTIGIKEGSETTERILKEFWEKLGYTVSIKHEDKISWIYVGGNSFSMLRRYIGGTTAKTKCLTSDVFRLSRKTREGILDGMKMTDGSRDKNRLYTSSKKMVDDILHLAHTLGRKALLSSVDERTVEEGSLSDNPIYCLSLPERTSYGEFFKETPDYHLYRIEKIEEGGVSDNLYCFEVANEEHLFELANGVVTHNCRLRLDVSELLKRGNGLFGSAEQTGSIGVVTLNCARIGYVFKGNKEGLFKRLDYLCDLAKTSLELKRKTIDRFMKEGLYPFTKRYLGSWRNFFSTIGVNGINEMIRNFTNDEHDITTEEGHAFAVEVLEHLNKRIQSYQVETGNLYNLEASPAEGSCHRFAREDKKRFPEIIQAGDPSHPYYTNSSQLPVNFTDDPFEALEMQEDLQRLYTGGTVLHLYMGERVSTGQICKEIVKRSLSNFRLPYITITPTFSICPKHGYIAGEHPFCPKCDAELIAHKRIELQNT